MNFRKDKNTLHKRHRVLRSGMTLMEMVIALSIITVIFAAILPLFGQIRQGWDSKQAVAETLQNGRILIDHIIHNLTKAVKITAVSDSTENNGYIEFENNDAETLRYDVNSTTNYIEYGTTGSLADLAGPVGRLKFTCYDPCDLDTPITDVNSIRFVKVETIFVNTTDASRNKTLTAAAYLRTNGNSGSGPGSTTQTTYDYSNQTQGINVFAYEGEDNVQVPAGSTTPSNAFNFSQYDDIEYDDDTFHTYSAPSNSKYAQIRFVIMIDENENDISQISAVFNGKGINTKKNNTDGVSFYIWNDTDSNYELLETSTDTEDEIALTGTLVDSLADYTSGAGANTITLLAVTNSKKANKEDLNLFTDYMNLEVTATSGGNGIYP
jgi:prepilin-type N-terminal cleavage/methylation domain-containing protein